jgi:hypothetical protein
MAHRSELDNCSCFNEVLASMPSVAGLMRDRYCKGTQQNCARIVVSSAVGGSHVPPDLAPNDSERAQVIVNSHRNP